MGLWGYRHSCGKIAFYLKRKPIKGEIMHSHDAYDVVHNSEVRCKSCGALILSPTVDDIEKIL